MDETNQREVKLTLVARKACFGLPTACPSCLPVYIYLKLAQLPFDLNYNLTYPDSDQIPYVESGDCYVAYNNEKGGVIESLKEDGIVDLDSEVHADPEWISMKAMITSWLVDAVTYELWVGSDGSSAHKIYYSDLPWPIGKFLYYKQINVAKQLLGITKENADRREDEIYRRSTIAYQTLSTRLGEDSFFFENRATSLDASFLGHVLFTLQALPDTSILKSKLLAHENLVKSAESFKVNYIKAGPSSSVPQFRVPSPYVPQSQSDSTASASASASAGRGSSTWGSNPKSKPKREKTEEEKTFRRRAKYFLVTQLVGVLIFLSLLGGSDNDKAELDDEDGLQYDD